MAWTINNGKLYFNTKLYTGNGANNHAITGVGFQPDLVWCKNRTSAQSHALVNSVTGRKALQSNATDAEYVMDAGKDFGTFDSNGFTVLVPNQLNSFNFNNGSIVSWNWLAAGTAPSNTYAVKVVSDSGNKYRFDNFGTSAVTLEISEGGTFTFDQSDSSNNGHPLRFATQADGANSSQYTTGVTTNGTPGQAGAYTRITVAASAPTLFYYCTNHSGMGGQANTPVTNSFSNFAGSIQSNISPNTTSGFSIVSYTGNGTGNSTIGHGLGATPKFIIVKRTSSAQDWGTYSPSFVSASDPNVLYLSKNSAQVDDTNVWGTSAVFNNNTFTVGDWVGSNQSGSNFIAYCFNDVQGFSKMGSYTGNGSTNGTFIYTGFKPAFVMIKSSSSAQSWSILDIKRDVNPNAKVLWPNDNYAEYDETQGVDFLSNGFKNRESGDGFNGSGATYIYMAFAENPFTSSAGTPVTAR